MEHTANHITLRGQLLTAPAFSHENHGKAFYRFLLEVPRLSGTVDKLPIIAQESLLSQLALSPGDTVSIQGQIRSHNVRTEERRRLLIFVFASTICRESGESINDVFLDGILCREPICRRTPLGREICDVMLAVRRGYNRADYLPCILWGSTAHLAGSCALRDRIQIRGRLQSRLYTKQTDQGAEERTAYEISALTMIIPDTSEL